MKNSTIILTMTLIVGFSACVPLPDLNPETNETLVVTEVGATYGFNHVNMFAARMDINGNGTDDFILKATKVYEQGVGSYWEIRLTGTDARNKVMARNSGEQILCGTPLYAFVPLELPANFLITPISQWKHDVLMYASRYAIAPETCMNSVAYVNYYTENYVAIKFFEGNEEFYGWVNLYPHTTWSSAGLVDAARYWEVREFAYNPKPGQGARIPS